MLRTYLVECYWPGVDADAVTAALARTEREPEAQWVDSILVPEDEILLCVVEGTSVEAVREASRRSGLPSERVTRSIRFRPAREGPA